MIQETVIIFGIKTFHGLQGLSFCRMSSSSKVTTFQKDIKINKLLLIAVPRIILMKYLSLKHVTLCFETLCTELATHIQEFSD